MPELSHSDSWVCSQTIAPFLCQIRAISTGIVCLGEVAAHKLLSTSLCPCPLSRVSKQPQSWCSRPSVLQQPLALTDVTRGAECLGNFAPNQTKDCVTSDVKRDHGTDPWLTGVIFSCYLPKPLFADSSRVGFCFDVLLSLKSPVLLLAPVIFGVLWREGEGRKK